MNQRFSQACWSTRPSPTLRAITASGFRLPKPRLKPSIAAIMARFSAENLAMMAAMEGFKRGFGSRNPLAVIARNVGLGLVDQQAWLKRWFMGQALS